MIMGFLRLQIRSEKLVYSPCGGGASKNSGALPGLSAGSPGTSLIGAAGPALLGVDTGGESWLQPSLCS